LIWMSGTYLLDSNAAIALLNGDDKIQEMLAEADAVYVPAVVIGELFYGAEKSARRPKNIERIEVLSEIFAVILTDFETGRVYGRLKVGLEKKGRPIPENDIWIAAVAIQHNLTLVTRDTHFNVVDGLSTIDW